MSAVVVHSTAAAVALAGCGGAGPPPAAPGAGDPSGDAAAIARPAADGRAAKTDGDAAVDGVQYVLDAPAGVDRWEPSGAVVLDERLWVVNDRDGWIAAYALPLGPGSNAPAAAHRLETGLARTKWEDAAPAGGGGLLLWEAISRSVWYCAEPAEGCPDLSVVDSEPFRKALDAALPTPVEYVSVEGLARQGERWLFATRGLVEKGLGDDAFRAWSHVFTALGRSTQFAESLVLDGRAHGISALALDGDVLWMTWSHEAPGDDTRRGVGGLLARARVGADGLPDAPELCRRFEGKPEGVASWGDRLVVVFDNDLRRKDPADPARFALLGRQDFALVLDKSAACPGEATARR